MSPLFLIWKNSKNGQKLNLRRCMFSQHPRAGPHPKIVKATKMANFPSRTCQICRFPQFRLGVQTSGAFLPETTTVWARCTLHVKSSAGSLPFGYRIFMQVHRHLFDGGGNLGRNSNVGGKTRDAPGLAACRLSVCQNVSEMTVVERRPALKECQNIEF